MDNINMAYVAGGIYFLGIYFHYIHVLTIFHLMDRDDVNIRRVIMHSLVWPWTVVMMLSEELLGDDQDEEDDER
tara:strand:- start:1090 stop:1311 length:222 start_codon:yes stop_codon:yes gene_type:complete